MIRKEENKKGKQCHVVCIDDLVPQDHLLRKIERAIDFRFIYELVEDKYSPNRGRPSIDPVMLIKMAMLQYLFGIRSMRQTVKDIQVNTAYRWFLGMDFYDEVPHFTTFGKNYSRRFAGTDLFERIFERILEECYRNGYVKNDTVFVDATHIKASANRHKRLKTECEQKATSYADELRKEINADREAHGKKAFEDDEDDDNPPPTKRTTQSTTDPESGMFVKGEHKRDFSYMAQTACDRNGFVLSYDVCAGNIHDSVSFSDLYEKIKSVSPCIVVADAGYKVPHIIRRLLKDGVIPLLPRVSPKTKDGFFRKYDYAYDEYHDCYVCPQNHVLSYSTTNREGYREYKSKSYICANCPQRCKCTNSRDCTKVVTRHVWQDYLDMAEEFRLTLGMKELYRRRKETIERVFADAKEKHGMRYTQYRGKAKVNMSVGLIFSSMNLKKLALWLDKKSSCLPIFSALVRFFIPAYTKAAWA